MSNPDKDRFFNPISNFRGEFSPQNLAFNANLQEFTNRISIICALETGGKISSNEAYQQIKELWIKLDASRQNLLGDD
ncbi:MAG: hypothetical protein ACK6CP_18650 [Pseudanabaena sp.]|jgi:hypothetical protein|nr:hypothetical protein [Pseudanabaena sp. M090S1SP2A07QC]MCA6506017.1 hypothetical protein [Pseudanabaena sp. M172S2SP2A07QC]MCA6510978.1 hypothetical protein [Pseudanabaena sp. M109S1SP2A07QC]MCA6520068.1 hypothetical protein [Pseudanabaena sp. M110S1SP2A07QC]MCA6524061.1 hypothetical protein [Pseudanabaena sp. M051S1SP2A07QC]MCA6527272.1 hypothetical protein [Pseudanabaena sp. M179S2SP2A07QC]MCA6532170.1 hypothetical protein [Pseudanabaena sp. M125S2SP2A07QC]MCA6536892.1 hypothetical prot